MNTSSCALFGKQPGSREFVRAGCYGEPELALEGAFARAVEAARGEASASAGRFLIAPRGEPALIGSWVASEDAIGRGFPLVLSHRLSGELVDAPLSVLPLHHGDLLEASERALREPFDTGVVSRLEALAPHPSLLLPSLHRGRSALARESVRRFQLRALADIEADALAYALATMLKAVALAEPVALALPGTSEDVLFAWLELSSAWRAEARSLLWCPGEDLAWLGLRLDADGLLARCWTAQAASRHCWPLRTADAEAKREACAYLGVEACALIERDASLQQLLAVLNPEAARAG